MATILRPGSVGDKAEILNQEGGAPSILSALSDNSDSTLVTTVSALALTSLFYLQAHGFIPGTTIASVTLYYRGLIISGAFSFVGVYKRADDGAEVADTSQMDYSLTTHSLEIPAPGGGWTLDELTALQIGARIRGDGVDLAKMADIWVSVDDTAPTFVPHGCIC